MKTLLSFFLLIAPLACGNPYNERVAALNKFFFKGKQNGFFIDVGANDGVNQSNTLFFEKNLN